jgi:Phosphotransferase system, galactitol-specific IIC component
MNKIKITPKTVQKRMGVFRGTFCYGIDYRNCYWNLAKYSVAKVLQLGVLQLQFWF